MGERLSSLFPLVLLVLLAALTYWLDRAVQSPAPPRETLLRHDPDYIVDKLLATRMDVNGRVRDKLHAARLTHYPDDDSTELTRPRFMSFGYGAPLAIVSNTALVSSNGGNIYFRGDVRATRAPYAANSELVVTTQYLHLLPDDNIARTDQAVTIADASMTISAVGMELNNETRVLKLNATVRGVYNNANATTGSKASR